MKVKMTEHEKEPSPSHLLDSTLISLGFHFDVTLISFRFHFDFTSISLRFHFDVTSISLRFHFNLTLVSLWFHLDFTSMSRWFHFAFTSISRRFHFDFNSTSLRFHFEFTLISLRCHFDFTWISLRCHFDFISISLRFHFDFTSISLWPPLKPSQIIVKTNASGTIPTGGSAAPREPARSPNSFEIKRNPTSTHQDPCRKHQGSSIISQNNFSFDFAKQSRAPNPKGTDPPERRSTNDNKKPSDRITHAGTIKISRSE